MAAPRKPQDRLQAEAQAGTVAVPLGGKDIRVLPAEKWHRKALRALRSGDYDGWAEGAVHPDDVQDYLDADVTVGEINDFFAAWGEASGQDVGESAASQRS